jgi:tetratricopeptide (TPR) repeat protein
MLTLSREASPTRLKLARFSKGQTHDLLETIFDEEITPEFLDAIHQETEGNPFFIEEVCKALVESGKVYFEGGGWHRPEIDELEIPQSVRVAIQARVARLPEAHQEILRLAALLGRDFEFEVLHDASGQDEDVIILALENAEKAQLIHEVTGKRQITFRFTHALFPSTLVEGIRTLRRRKLHKQIAQTLEELQPDNYEKLAFHYGESGGDEKALTYYSKAGERASNAFANQEAKGFLLAALDLTEEDRERADLLTRLGIVQDRLGAHGDAIDTWESAIEGFQKLGEVDKATELYARCGRVSWELGDTPGNLTFCLEGLNLIDDRSEGPGVAKLLAETGRAYYFNNELDEVEGYCRRALEIAEKYDAIDVQADALITLGLIPTLPPEEAIAYYEKAIEITEAAGYWEQAARAHNNISTRLSYLLGDIQKSMEHLLQAAEHAHKIGAISHELFYRSSAMGWLIRTGDLDLVEASLPDLYKLMEEAPDSQYAIALMRAMEANLYRHQGELEKATRTLREILLEAKSAGDPQAISGTSILLIDALIEMGNLEEAKALVMELIPISDSGSFYGAITPRSYLATIFAEEGDFDNAHKVLEEASILIRNTDSRAIEELYLLISEARVAIRQKQWNVGWEKAEKLKLLFEKYAFRWNRALLLLEWSQACLTRSREQDFEQAQEMLQEAISEFKDMGALPYKEQAEALLEEVLSKTA